MKTRSTKPLSTVFIAFEPQRELLEDLRILTPRVMEWHDGLWLMDLSPSISYWQKQAGKKDQTLVELLQAVLGLLAPEGYRAGCSNHPFRALLLVQLLKEKKLNGLIDSQSPFGRSLFRQLSWTSFWSVSEKSLPHFFLECGTKKTRIHQFQRDRRLMQRAVQRLSLNTPTELSHTSKSSIHRRFGPLIAKLWEWTFPSESAQPPSSEDFPFIPYIFMEQPQLKRTLDFPLLGWAHLEPLLAQDLSRLCFHESYTEGDLVTSLEWHVVLQDLSALTIPVLFRHPHDLRSDLPNHQAALLQAYYSFLNVSQTHFQDDNEAELPPPAVVSWELKITGLMPKRQQVLDIFQEECLGQDELERLENLLAVPLTQYEAIENWCAEDAFRLHMPQKKSPLSPEAQASIRALSTVRPPFIYERPIPLKNTGSSLKRFLERTMDKWWLAEEQNGQRDYYLMIDESMRHLWVYQDTKGDWYAHGIYA